MTEEKNTMTIGAGGEAMHSLHAGKSGKVTARYLKTAPVNQQLSALYAFQTASSATHGQNILTIQDTARGDNITCQQVAFAKLPSVTYSKDGQMMEWEFHCGVIDTLLGSGAPALI